MRFPARQRLRANLDFENVRNFGKRFRFKGFLAQLKVNLNTGTGRRLGLRVNRKTGNAVVRNRVKRVLREHFRIYQQKLPPDCDLILVPYPNLLSIDRGCIREGFEKLCDQVDPQEVG